MVSVEITSRVHPLSPPSSEHIPMQSCICVASHEKHIQKFSRDLESGEEGKWYLCDSVAPERCLLLWNSDGKREKRISSFFLLLFTAAVISGLY